MPKLRLLFTKDGPARYISHLDLMQVFRRAFARADIPLTFTQGFNPHPYLSAALPLPTSFASRCELLDFETELGVPSAAVESEALPEAREPQDWTKLPARLNAALPTGITVLEVYEEARPVKFIDGVLYEIRVACKKESAPCADEVRALFGGEPLMTEKRTKRGVSTVNLLDYIRSLTVEAMPGGLLLTASLPAGDQSLNPEYLVHALEERLPALGILGAEYLRLEIYDTDGKLFR